MIVIPIEQFQIALRPRTAWESLDLGVALARHGYRSLLYVWLIASLAPSLLIAILLRHWTVPFAMPGETIQFPISLLVIWWFKPIFERALLGCLRRQAFGEPPMPAALWREWLSGCLRWGLGDLLWRRLSMTRSFLQPVIQLEENGWRSSRRRQRLLRRQRGRLASWSTVLFSLFEGIAFGGILILGLLMFSGSLGDGVADRLLEQPALASWGVLLLYYVVVSLLEPFYVASGFSLYLHARTELEAWDIQLGFMQIARRSQTVFRMGVLLLIGVVLSGVLLTVPDVARAERVQESGDSRCARFIRRLESPLEAPEKRELQEILKAPEFYPCQTEGRWVRRPGRSDVALPRWLAHWLESLAQGVDQVEAERVRGRFALEWLGPMIQRVVLLILGALTAIAFGFLMFRLGRYVRGLWLQLRHDAADDAAALETTLAATHSLPANALDQVESLVAAAQIRAALSLLYRVVLADLERRFRIEIPHSATETESIFSLQEKGGSEITRFFVRLIHCWQAVAYAHRSADPVDVLTLRREWSTLREHDPFSGEVHSLVAGRAAGESYTPGESG